MARRSIPAPPAPEPELKLPVPAAAAKLDERIAKGRELRERQITSPQGFVALEKDYERWDNYNYDLLARAIFTTDKIAKEYSSAGFPGVLSVEEPTQAQRLRELHEYLDGKMTSLESIKERLELIPLTASARGVGPTPAQPLYRSWAR